MVTWSTFAADERPVATQVDDIVALVSAVLPEKYSRFTYCYFLYSWPWLCHMVNRWIPVLHLNNYFDFVFSLPACSKFPIYLFGCFSHKRQGTTKLWWLSSSEDLHIINKGPHEAILACWWSIQSIGAKGLVRDFLALIVVGIECIRRFIFSCANHVNEVLPCY